MSTQGIQAPPKNNSSTEITPIQEDNNTQIKPSSPSFLHPSTHTTVADTTTATSAHKLLKFIGTEIDYIKETSKKLNDYKTHAEDKVKNASVKLDNFKPIIETPKNTSLDEDPPQTEENVEEDLRKLKKSVRKLKLPLAASKFHIDYRALDKDPNLCSSNSAQDRLGNAANETEIIRVPNLYTSKLFEQSSLFRDFKARFEDIGDIKLKLCILCFSVFPEGAVIKKRLMVYWWITEGFVEDMRHISAEENGCKYFNLLITKGFIKPVDEKRWKIGEVGSCTMDRLTRLGVIKLADKIKMFDFDANGNPKEDFSFSLKACLSGKGLVNIPNLDKLHMLFNVDENYLEFKRGWFSKMKNVHVVYLGRWKASGKHHIEVEDVQFLEELELLKYLKFLSFQGVSRITELPESISKLDHLIILDLRACHNLESVPDGIGALKNLSHLDLWECYLLDHMPKHLASLKKLQVLKGFVIGGDSKASCTLQDLTNLKMLRKLSILAKIKGFPRTEDLNALSQFEELHKLTIAWGGGSSHASGNDEMKKPRNETKRTFSKQKTLNFKLPDKVVDRSGSPNLPKNLVKLDLQCYPQVFAPDWLNQGDLQHLKKLYIRGGKLRYLRIRNEGKVDDKWNVVILRLKYLCDLEMEWKELHKLFPDVVYLEKVKCPRLTLFPCDQYGIWMKKTNKIN